MSLVKSYLVVFSPEKNLIALGKNLPSCEVNRSALQNDDLIFEGYIVVAY